MPAALANNQKAYLSQLARQAFEKLRADATRAGRVYPAGHALAGWPTDATLWDPEEFRHAEVAKACHKNGLRCCSQDDYGSVKGHFLALIGREGAAMKAMVQGAGNGKRTAEMVLLRELTAANLRQGYAEAICRNKYKCTIADATERQVWTLVYDVRRTAAGRKRKKGVESRKPSVESLNPAPALDPRPSTLDQA